MAYPFCILTPILWTRLKYHLCAADGNLEGLMRLSDLPKRTQLVSSGIGMQTWAAWLQGKALNQQHASSSHKPKKIRPVGPGSPGRRQGWKGAVHAPDLQRNRKILHEGWPRMTQHGPFLSRTRQCCLGQPWVPVTIIMWTGRNESSGKRVKAWWRSVCARSTAKPCGETQL